MPPAAALAPADVLTGDQATRGSQRPMYHMSIWYLASISILYLMVADDCFRMQRCGSRRLRVAFTVPANPARAASLYGAWRMAGDCIRDARANAWLSAIFLRGSATAVDRAQAVTVACRSILLPSGDLTIKSNTNPQEV